MPGNNVGFLAGRWVNDGRCFPAPPEGYQRLLGFWMWGCHSTQKTGVTGSGSLEDTHLVWLELLWEGGCRAHYFTKQMLPVFLHLHSPGNLLEGP